MPDEKNACISAVPPVLCLMAVPGASAADISVRDEFAAHLPGSPARSSCTIPPATSISSITSRKKTVVPLFHLQNLQLAHRPGNRRIGPGRCIHAVQMERDAILFSPYWNHDHTLASATRESVVWYFQSSPRASARNGCRNI